LKDQTPSSTIIKNIMMHLRPLATAENSVAHQTIIEDPWGGGYHHDGAHTVVSKDWTHLSLNSDEINQATSPFDDIGYLATDNLPSKSFNMKGCSNGTVDPPTPEVSNQKPIGSENDGNNQRAVESANTGPSLNDFFQRDKTPSLTPQQRQLNKDIISKASSRMPFRRGHLFKGVSKRGDIANLGDITTNNNIIKPNSDDESVGISTIVSMNTTKRTNRMFEISKGSLTLSMLGASKVSNYHNSNNKYNDSKSRGTRTTEATSNHTKSTVVSAFGSSMFSRESSKSKERLREMVDQLEGTNRTLTTENQQLKARIEKVAEAWNEVSLYRAWFSIQELADLQTELSQLRTFQSRTTREQKDLEAEIETLAANLELVEKEKEDLRTENRAQAERIAYLEVILLENQLDPSHHYQVVTCENMSQSSFGSFGSFGTLADEADNDQKTYEERLNGSCVSRTFDGADDGFEAFCLIPNHKKNLELPLPPPPPPSRRCLTDPCNSIRKKPREATSSKSPGKGNRRKSQELESSHIASTKESSKAGTGPVISTTRLSDYPRRARSVSTGHRPNTAVETRSVDAPRTRRPKTYSNEKEREIVPSGLTKHPSRRRLKKSNTFGDGLDNSQHSAKSNKSSKSSKSSKSGKSLRSNKSSGTGRRRAIGKPVIDSMGETESSHSTKSAARRRLRNVTQDRGTVRDALDRLVGAEEEDLQVNNITYKGTDRPSSEPTHAAKVRRCKSSDLSILVSSKPMALVQDHAKINTVARIEPRHSTSWATSA
jgi:cell division protein FtsB